FGGLADAIRAVSENVRQGANEHAEIAIPCAHAADALRAVIVERERAVWFCDDDWSGAAWLEDLLARDWTGTRTPASVWRGEGLVQVQVHHVGTEVAGARFAAERVH